MTAVALCCAALAAWWAFPPVRRMPGPPAVDRARRNRRVGLPLLAVIGLLLVWIVVGPRVAVPVTAVGIVVATVARVVVLRTRLRRARQAAADIAQAATVLAAELELGRVPATALLTAAADCPVLVPAATAAEIGGDVVQTWERQAKAPGCGGLLVLSRAWRVAAVTGSALGPSLAAVAMVLGAEEEVDRLVAGELAAPRMTGVVLALLPVAGIGLGYAIGGDPLGFLLGAPWGWACLLAGTALACIGLLWTERLAGTGT